MTFLAHPERPDNPDVLKQMLVGLYLEGHLNLFLVNMLLLSPPLIRARYFEEVEVIRLELERIKHAYMDHFNQVDIFLWYAMIGANLDTEENDVLERATAIVLKMLFTH